MADTASISDPHVKVGVVAGDGGAAVWPVLTPSLRTREFLYTGDPIPAAVAVELGLATRVVPAPQLMEEAVRVATRLSELPRRAFELTKRATNLNLLESVRRVMPYAIAAEQLTFREPEIEKFLASRRA
jgi:enoyl-CoA hydratase